MNTISKERIFGLDLMRAIAILLVVLSHCAWFFPNLEGVLFTMINYAGLFGVEIFFVLSGFLIGRILYRSVVLENFTKKKLLAFWKRRWLRTLPNYYLVLLINIILAYFLFKDLPSDSWKYFLFFQNFWSEQTSFFYESWSLSVEEFAYLLAPVVLYAAVLVPLKASKEKVFLVVSVLVIVLGVLIRLKYHYINTSFTLLQWTTQLKSVVIYRVDVIFYGFIAAYFSIRHSKGWVVKKYILLICGALLFLVFNFWMTKGGKQNQLIWNVFYLPINSIAIALSLPFFSNFKLKSGYFYKVITHTSLISYAIYLLHYTIILKITQFYLPKDLSEVQLALAIMGYLSLTLLLSQLLYRYFEKPMMNLREKRTLPN